MSTMATFIKYYKVDKNINVYQQYMFPCFSKYLSKSVKKRGAFEFLKQGSKVNDFTNVHIYTFTRGPGILGTNEW